MKMRIVASLLLFIICTSCGQRTITPTPMPTATPWPAPSHAASPSPPTPTPAPTPSPIPDETPEIVYTKPTIIAPIEEVLVYDYPPRTHKPTDDNTRPMPTMPKGIKLTPNDQDVFLPADMIAGNMSYGTMQEQAFEIMGEPEVAYSYTFEAYGGSAVEWYYDNGDILSFSDLQDEREYRLDGVYILSDLPGPRGIAVGDTLDKVLSSFRIDPESAQGYDEYGELPLYARARVPSIRESPPDDLLDPKGMLFYDDRYWRDEDEHEYLVLYYEHPEDPYTVEEIISGEKEYIFLWHIHCQFVFVDRELISYRWSHGPHAE